MKTGVTMMAALAVVAVVVALTTAPAQADVPKADVPKMDQLKHMRALYRAESHLFQPMQFHLHMRRLWFEHVFYTRNYIVAAFAADPALPQARTRLLLNQKHIGSFIATVYGPEAGDELEALLVDHIAVAADIVAGVINDAPTVSQDVAKWEANAREIAAFLARANPEFFCDVVLNDYLSQHLDTTTQEVLMRKKQKWGEEIVAVDAVISVIADFADYLAYGIIAQQRHFPTSA